MNPPPVAMVNAVLHPLAVALYQGVCALCGEPLEWEYESDADGPSWRADCCAKTYELFCETVTVSVEGTEAEG